MHTITIRPVNQGYIVTVGCQELVFTDKKKMVRAFKDYMEDPKAAQEKYCDTVNCVPPPPQEAMRRGVTTPGIMTATEVDNRIYGQVRTSAPDRAES